MRMLSSRWALVAAAMASSACTETDPLATDPQEIIGGHAVLDDELPSMAMVGTDPEAFFGFFAWCGGTVIGERWVLTAAHCLELFPLDFGGEVPVEVTDLRIIVDRVRFSQIRLADLIPVEAGYMHPGYDPLTFDNDVALLRTSVPLAAPPMPLLTPIADWQLLPAGRLATTAGWGATDPDDIFSSSRQLLAVDVPIVDRAQCDGLYAAAQASLTDVTANMICAGDLDHGGVDACVGDSGGPLFITEAGRQLLAGSVSVGEGCAQAAFPGVYARAATTAGWIEACVADPGACGLDDAALPPIHPTLRCVDDLGHGRYRAHFGYRSESAISLAIPPGVASWVLFDPDGDVGQPTVFAPGVTADAFTVPFRGLTAWWLLGPDGGFRVALAWPGAPRC